MSKKAKSVGNAVEAAETLEVGKIQAIAESEMTESEQTESELIPIAMSEKEIAAKVAIVDVYNDYLDKGESYSVTRYNNLREAIHKIWSAYNNQEISDSMLLEVIEKWQDTRINSSCKIKEAEGKKRKFDIMMEVIRSHV